MTELIFIEGVSGVGKSTMVRMLSEELKLNGYNVKSYLESDYTNPIDFYSTAYLSLDEYEKLCNEYASVVDIIKANTIGAGEIMLVKYYNKAIPLFEEPLLSKLMEREFCYNPSHLVELSEYTCVYKNVWKNYALSIDETYDYIIFDGSLLHHPINDMMRNYHIDGEQAASHVCALLNTLGTRKKWIFYLKAEDIERQLKFACKARNQSTPTNRQIEFWKNRYNNDMIVLNHIKENCQIYDIFENDWEAIRAQIVKRLL